MLRELKRNYRRLVAFMLTAAMTFTNVGTNLNVAFAAGEEESGLFLLSSEDLRGAIDEALEAGETFDYATLEVTADSKSLLKKYKELLGGANGKVYELNVDVDDSYAPMDTELQVFYNEGTENVVFLFINGSDMAVTFRANVDGYETARVTVNPNTQIAEDAANAEDYSNAIAKDDIPETLGAEVIPASGAETTEAEETTEGTTAAEGSAAETSAEETGEAEETSEADNTEATSAAGETSEAAETSPAETAESTEATTESATVEAATTAEETETTREEALTEEATTATETEEMTAAPAEAETQSEAPAEEEEAFRQAGMSVHKVQLVASTVTILNDEVPGAPEPEDEKTTGEETTAGETIEAADEEDAADETETKVEIVKDATTESAPADMEENTSAQPETTTEAADPAEGAASEETPADDTTAETTEADETFVDGTIADETTADETLADEILTDETIADETIADETTAADLTTDGGAEGDGAADHVVKEDGQLLEDDVNGTLAILGDLEGRAYNTVTVYGEMNARAYRVALEDIQGIEAIEGVYQVDYSVDPVGAASIKGADSVKEGENLYFAVVPQVGYEIAEVTANGDTLEAIDTADVASASNLSRYEYVYAVEEVDTDLEIVASLEETGTHPAFDEKVTLNGVTIRATAEEGILPEGTTLDVQEVTSQVEEAVKEKVESETDAGTTVTTVIAYDINLMLDGKKLENEAWNSEEGNYVTVTFSGSRIEEASKEADKIHIASLDTPAEAVEGALGGTETMALVEGVTADDIEVNAEGRQAIDVSGDASVKTVALEAEHFTVYTITFTVEEQIHSLSLYTYSTEYNAEFSTNKTPEISVVEGKWYTYEQLAREIDNVPNYKLTKVTVSSEPESGTVYAIKYDDGQFKYKGMETDTDAEVKTLSENQALYAWYEPQQQTVTFVNNDSPNEEIQTYDLKTEANSTSITLPYQVITGFENKEGRTLLGWALQAGITDAAGIYEPGQTYQVTAGTTLYAIWARKVTYLENTGNDTDGRVEQSVPVTGKVTTIQLPENFSNGGKLFVGWAGTPNGNEVSTGTLTSDTYVPGAIYPSDVYDGNGKMTGELLINKDVTLYAMWLDTEAAKGLSTKYYVRLDGTRPYEPTKYNVGLYTAGLEGTLRQHTEINNKMEWVAANILEEPTPSDIETAVVKKQKSFDPETQKVEWYVIKREGDNWHVDGRIVNKNAVTLTYDPNGGQGAPNAESYSPNTPVDVKVALDSKNPNAYAMPERPGYTFLGWAYNSNDGTPYFYEGKESGNTFIITEDTTLYAVWKANETTLFYVEHYLQTDDSFGEPSLTSSNFEMKKGPIAYSGTTGMTVSDDAYTDTFPGYEYESGLIDGKTEGTVIAAADGVQPLVLKLYYKLKSTQVTVTKVWDDDGNRDGVRENVVKIQLYADGDAKGDPLTLSEGSDTNKSDGENKWSGSFTGLQKMRNGKPIEYTVKELKADNSEPVEEGGQIYGGKYTVSYATEKQEDGTTSITVTNTHKIETTYLNVAKAWMDEADHDGVRPRSITVALYKAGTFLNTPPEEYDTFEPVYDELGNLMTLTLTARSLDLISDQGYWEGRFDNLPRYERVIRDGKESSENIFYVARELDGNGERVTDSPYESKESAEGAVLMENGLYYKPSNKPLNENYKITVHHDEWSKDQKRFGTLILNGHEVQRTTVSGEKIWDDADYFDANGKPLSDYYARPESITVYLTGTVPVEGTDKVETVNSDRTRVTPNAEGKWLYSFDNLYTMYQGKEITYTVSEAAVPGYENTVVKTEIGYNITNTPIKGEQIDPTTITLKKVDSDTATGAGLGGAQFTLTGAQGENYGSYVTGEDGTVDITFAVAGTYTLTETAAPVNYVAEKTVYEITVSKSGVDKIQLIETDEGNVWTWLHHLIVGEDAGYDAAANILTVGNKAITKTVTVTKTWADSDDRDGYRPDSVSVQLYQDGKAYGEPVVLTASGEWKQEFTGLPTAVDGTAVVYSVRELNAAGTAAVAGGESYDDHYTVSYSGSEADGFIVTNSHTPETDNGGGNGGSSGGGGSSSGPNRGTTTTSTGGPGANTTTITPEDVPLANLPADGDPALITMIDDEEVPLAALPKTGQTGANALMLLISGMMLAAFAVAGRKKEDQ